MGRMRRPWMTSSEKRMSCGGAGVSGESPSDDRACRSQRELRVPSISVVTAEGGIAPEPRRRSRRALTSRTAKRFPAHVAQGRSLRAISRAR